MLFRSLAVSTLVAAGLALAAPAFAGECPPGQMRADATKPVNYGPKAVTDMVLAQIDLAGEKIALKGHLMRVRKLEIQPGGIVPWHSHGDRPALIYVQSGEIYEHASNCAVPILHKAGEIGRESNGLKHWWKNEGNVTVVLTIADIVNDKKPETMARMM